MKFCPYCGRQLQDNEACNCQQSQQVSNQTRQPQNQQLNQQFSGQPQNQQFNQQSQAQFNQAQYQAKPTGPSVGNILLGFCTQIFTKPYDAIVNYVRSGSVGAAYIMVIIAGILSFLNNICDEAQKASYSIYLKFSWADVAKESAIDLLQLLAVASLAALVFSALTNYFEKQFNSRVTFTQAIMIFSLTDVIYKIFSLISNLLDFTNVDFFEYIGDVIARYGYGFQIIITALVVSLFVKDKNKVPFTFAISLAAGKIAAILINVIFTLGN